MRTQACGLTVGFMCLMFFSGFLIAQSQQSIRAQVFGETDDVKKRADDMKAALLAPESRPRASGLIAG